MNRSAVKLLAITMTAAALAVSTAHAGTQQWLGEYVPFDAAADVPQPDVSVSGPVVKTIGESSIWLGENVRFDFAADAPSQIAFEAGFPASDDDYYTEFSAPADEPSIEPPLLVAGIDPLEVP